ncbi:MAG: carbohydrate-binding domain-containing protein, partial [Rhodopila sp.]
MAGDSAVGVDPQFTLNVDGQQIGGQQSVSALQSSGQTQTFTFQGNFAPGPHDLTVTFTNNFLMPGESGDRNLYIVIVTYDGQTVSNTTTPVYQSPVYPPNSTQGDILGNAVFHVNDMTAVSGDASSTPTTTPGAVSVGSGSNTLVLNMAEDAYQGDAQFTVSVDGQQVGGTQTTTASVAQGQQQEFDVHGNWGSGSHSISVTFTNNNIGGSYPGTQAAIDTTDRNVYVMNASLDGGPPASGTPWELSSNGSQSFTVTAGSGGSSGSGGSGGSSNASSSNGGSGGGSGGGGSSSSDAATATGGSTGSSTDSSTGSSGSSSGSSSTGTSDTGNTATITSDSLNAGGSGTGSSSGMSFVASSNNSGSTAGTSGSGGSNSSGTSLGNSTTSADL